MNDDDREHALAEAAILGGVLLANESLARIADVEPADFDDYRHRVVFLAMQHLAGVGVTIDVRSLAAEIGGSPERYEESLRWVRSSRRATGSALDAIGGVRFLEELAAFTASGDDVAASGRLLKRLNVVVLCPNCALPHRFPLCGR